MLFNSLHFLVFFPVVVTLYFCIKQKYRWFLLLICSYYFYMSWKPEYIILIIISTIVDYIAALQIYASKEKYRKKMFLGLSLLINLGLLFTFKYFNFFSQATRLFLQQFSIQIHPTTLKVLLPIGISFYTFQTLSYTIEVYRGNIRPERHLGIFALYVSFFPQLVAGPIERPQNLLPQFYELHTFNYSRVTNGLKLMLWGFFKKLVIANKLALYVDLVYGNVTSYLGIHLILATIFFGFQIYCDFSGYSDIAIGAAQVLGFKLMDNFKRPYFSQSVSEFWKRWHISLSSWFKDYLYIPLGGNRVSKLRWYFNLLIVFIVSGIWHGANWTFICWGALHGSYLVFYLIIKKYWNYIKFKLELDEVPELYLIISIISTFILVNVGWIFFRSNSISDAIYILTHLSSGWTFENMDLIGANRFFTLIISILFLLIVEIIQEHVQVRQYLSEKPVWLRWGVYLGLALSIVFLGENNLQFIYYEF